MTWAATYSRLRTTFGARQVRHGGHLYQVPPMPARNEIESSGMVRVEGASGVCRFLVSELKKPYPKPGDTLDIKHPLSGQFDPYTILDTDPQQGGETLLVTYGAQYAS